MLRDTTLRSVIFGTRDLEMTPGPGGQVILKTQVDPSQFTTYEYVLKVMGQLSRIVYCDSGVIDTVIRSPEFGGVDNTAVNDLITRTDKSVGISRTMKSEFPNSKDGRPMKSYMGPRVSSKTGPGLARYVSTPDDVTFLMVSGSILKNPFKAGDAVLTFKGSSTVDNFKHDLYSQFTRGEASPGKYVPGSFLKHLKDNLSVIKSAITDFKPTRLFITGHSLGGAYATLCTYLLLLEKVAFPMHLVTFGSPTIVADGARNEFNTFLDSGKVTLDRVVSRFGAFIDPVSSIPAGFSHPGFQPLKTEFYPELKTGRAYSIDTIRKVYQKGGGAEKNVYEGLTKTHMPNRVYVPTLIKAFPHAGYMDMTYLGAFRLMGMKNPGFPGNTFVANLYDDGMNFAYIPSAVKDAAPDSASNDSIDKAAVPGTGGRTRRARRHKVSKRYVR